MGCRIAAIAGASGDIRQQKESSTAYRRQPTYTSFSKQRLMRRLCLTCRWRVKARESELPKYDMANEKRPLERGGFLFGDNGTDESRADEIITPLP